MLNFCGPEKESCVVKQPLTDKRCLVPCTGLYADIEDNYLQANVIAGRVLLNIQTHISGFNLLSHGVADWIWEDESKERLQQMFPTTTKEAEAGMKSFTESYYKYKREYVNHLSFNPEEENLSMYFFLIINFHFLSDPLVPGVQSMGPDVCLSIKVRYLLHTYLIWL